MLLGGLEKSIHIGLNYAGSDSELNGCVSDAVNVLKLSIDLGITDISLGIDVDISNKQTLEKKTMTSARTTMYNNMDKIAPFFPTKDNILSEIRKAVSDDKICSLFLTYSGHGASGEYSADNVDESDGINEYMCTLGNSGKFEGTYESFISDDELFDCIKEASDNRVSPLIITYAFDCCHSGTIFDLPFSMKKINDKITYSNEPQTQLE